MPRLTYEQILAWADVHYRRTGDWPKQRSGNVIGAPGEVWNTINAAIGIGRRGLPGGTTLAKLLAKHRGKKLRRPSRKAAR